MAEDRGHRLDARPVRPAAGMDVYVGTANRLRPRRREEILPFFDDTELLEPGLVPVHEWRADDPHASAPRNTWGLGESAASRRRTSGDDFPQSPAAAPRPAIAAPGQRRRRAVAARRRWQVCASPALAGEAHSPGGLERGLEACVPLGNG
ncbi:MAG TPA: SAM-dependent methyltransferase [Streptosporangiaceae bacterium]|nr:SAM-dependent methyltransferase [Streptosporangiaceae bacterium]